MIAQRIFDVIFFCDIQRRLAIVVFHIKVGAAFDEPSDHFRRVTARDKVKRRIPVSRLRVDIRALLHKKFRYISFPPFLGIDMHINIAMVFYCDV